MSHNTIARHAAAAVPIVLFGDYGRTVEGYRPADEDLAMALPASSGHRSGQIVTGPHLRPVHGTHGTKGTLLRQGSGGQAGIVGISLPRRARDGRHFLYVNLGSTSRKFCVETLGSSEAWRRAIALRRAHVTKLALANAAILAARARNSFQ
jgi:hypothetical protein